MLYGQPALGFSLKSLATTAAHVAQDPNVQRLAVTSAQAYAPAQTAQFAHDVQQGLQVVRQVQRAARGPRPRMRPLPPPPLLDDEGSPMPRVAPVQKSHILTFAMIGGAVLVLLLVLKR